MQVDHRSDYKKAGLKLLLERYPSHDLNLTSLSKPSQFYGQGVKSRLNYAFVKCVVKNAITEIGMPVVSKEIEQVGWQREFPTRKYDKFAIECFS